ncbi:MAG: nicotinate phosphoribosyltransferase [Acidobacteria bacterium]|nr:nicotinate phosphoribosyltransferase [Acidobacteriota bacterium]
MPSALSTDLYELTMAAGHYGAGAPPRATFELSVRSLPRDRGYLLAAGIEPALVYLEGLCFTAADIEYLRQIPQLRRAPAGFFDDYLPGFRFSGDVWAVAEGEPVFPNEPLLRVTAPLIEGQIVETALLSTVLFQTSVASRASRVVRAAAGRPVFELGARRAHGAEAGALAGRAAFIGGCSGTSDVEAGLAFGLPLAGTMAHSWVMSHDSEKEAFIRFIDMYGDRTVLLIDTYDSERAVDRIAAAGLSPFGVRLDSGDLLAESRAIRARLDAAGLRGTRIFASGDLDERRIAELVEDRAPIDIFGVGTALSTSSDAPALGGVYKLVEVDRAGLVQPVLKLSRGKGTYPGPKQVWRVADCGAVTHDVLATDREPPPGQGRALLSPVMRRGRRLRPGPPMREIQGHALRAVEALPAGVLRLEEPTDYQVVVSDGLVRLTEDLRQRMHAVAG